MLPNAATSTEVLSPSPDSNQDGSFPKEGDPNIDPNTIILTIIQGPQKGTPYYGKPPYRVPYLAH